MKNNLWLKFFIILFFVLLFIPQPDAIYSFPNNISHYVNSLYPISHTHLAKTVDSTSNNILFFALIIGCILIFIDRYPLCFSIGRILIFTAFVIGEATVFVEPPYMIYGLALFLKEVCDIIEGVILILLFIPSAKEIIIAKNISNPIAKTTPNLLLKASQPIETQNSTPKIITTTKKRKLSYIFNVWLNMSMFVFFYLLTQHPAFKNILHAHGSYWSAIWRNDFSITLFLSMGYLVCISALYKLKKWGFFGFLIIYALSIPLYYQQTHSIHLILPAIWITITYILLKKTTIGEKTLWDTLLEKSQKKSIITHENKDGAVLSQSNITSRVLSYLFFGIIIALGALQSITLLFPMPQFSFIKIVSEHQITVSILCAICLYTCALLAIIFRKIAWLKTGFIIPFLILMILWNLNGLTLVAAQAPLLPFLLFYIYSKIFKKNF